MTGETFWAKAWTSVVAAIAMYWMRVPHAVVLLMIAQLLALFTGAVVAFVRGEFQKRKLLNGMLLRIIAYPLLAICDLAEDPLHLTFHLDSYAALVLFAYEFLSIIQNYSRVRPLPKIIQIAADRVQEYLSTPNMDLKKVETITRRVEVEPTESRPIAPSPVVVTTVKETHLEAVQAEPTAKAD